MNLARFFLKGIFIKRVKYEFVINGVAPMYATPSITIPRPENLMFHFDEKPFQERPRQIHYQAPSLCCSCVAEASESKKMRALTLSSELDLLG